MVQIFEKIEEWNSKINPKTKTLLSVLLFTWFVMSSLFSHVLFGKWDFREILVNGSLVVMAVGTLTMRKENFTLRFFLSPPMIILIFIGFCFLVNSIIFQVKGYLALALQCFVVIPYYWMGIFSDKDRVIPTIAGGFLASYLIVLLMMFFLGPEFTLFQNSGLFGNPNLMGYYLTAVSASILYFLCRTRDQMDSLSRAQKIIQVINLVLLGSVAFITFCTTSRTSIVCVAGEILLALIFSLQKIQDHYKKGTGAPEKNGALSFKCFLRILKDLSSAVAIMAFAALMTYLIFIYGKPRFEQAFYGGGSTFYEQYLYDPSAAMDDELESSFRYYIKGLGDHDLLNFTSGRIEIWKIFIRHLRFIGHKTETLFITFSTRHNRSHGAHNIFIQLAYSIGLPAGILFFLAVFACDLYYFLRLILPRKRGRIRPEEMMILMAGSALALNAMTSSGYLFGRYLVPSCFILIAGPDWRRKPPKWAKRWIQKAQDKEASL